MRSLILAGGGMKVAYQAGCLQVLMDEAKIPFDHVDAASGGCFNAALWASGRTGTEIADVWRTTRPLDFITLNYAEYLKLLWLRSIGTADGVRRVLHDVWALDYEKIRAFEGTTFTFNHFDFAEKRVKVVENAQLDEDLLVASVTLLLWTPPVSYAGRELFDAVWCTDGNVSEAVSRGADEIWAIWTVSDLPEIRPGFIASYFHLIETVADAKFKQEWSEIKAVNSGIAAAGAAVGGRTTTDLRLAPGFDPQKPPPPPPGRKHIHQYLIEQEVGMHYVLNASRDRAAAAVELGVADARAYCRKVGCLPQNKLFSPGTPTGVQFGFRETIRGSFMPGIDDPVKAARAGARAGNSMTLHLEIDAAHLDAFLRKPKHAARIRGTVDAPLLSGARMPIEKSSKFYAFVDDRRSDGRVIAGQKKFLYEIGFKDSSGRAFLLKGEKRIENSPTASFWSELTTLYVHLSTVDGQGTPTAFGAGVVRVHLRDLVANLATFRVGKYDGPGAWRNAVRRYLAFFVGRSWDVYLRGLLDYAPF